MERMNARTVSGEQVEILSVTGKVATVAKGSEVYQIHMTKLITAKAENPNRKHANSHPWNRGFPNNKALR